MKQVIILLLFPITLSAQTLKPRKYDIGKITRYRLTSESYNNDKYAGKSVSIANLAVIKDSADFAEEITWLSKTSFSPKDTMILDSVAQKIKPYKISLVEGRKVLLPKLDNPVMVGEITDLNTFFVAISPALNIHKLSKRNPVFRNEKNAQGNFADGIMILKGNDCIKVTQTLIKVTKHYTIVKTDFFPPNTFCLTPLLDTVSKKIFEYPNNFQMVQKMSGEKVNFLWGNESFTIISRIDNSDGKILEATMTNVLNLRMRINSSKDLSSYEFEMPYKISRNLKLELLN